MAPVIVQQLTLPDLTPGFLAKFNRHQAVARRWMLEGGTWQLKATPFLDDWDPVEKEEKTALLRQTLVNNGAVWGAYQGERLIGFASLEPEFFGSQKQYLLLHFLHVDATERGNGYGRLLFNLACAEARQRGARKLYISTSTAEDTQAFYLKAGCVDAAEIDPALAAAEPFDRQMEFDLLLI